jgi:FKBP-type peptidyl-prolyl cis-trans isomerase SlyD
MIETVQDGAVVSLAYKLTLPSGEEIDSSDASEPLEYLHGAENIIPGLERQLTGLRVGDAKTVEVSPAEGYGEYDPEEVEVIDRRMLPRDMELRLGMVLAVRDDEGYMNEAYVSAIAPENVTLDFNHPLAGQQLVFDVQVVGLREATPEEIEHGHIHGDDIDEDDDFDDEDFELELEDFDDEDFEDEDDTDTEDEV